MEEREDLTHRFDEGYMIGKNRLLRRDSHHVGLITRSTEVIAELMHNWSKPSLQTCFNIVTSKLF